MNTKALIEKIDSLRIEGRNLGFYQEGFNDGLDRAATWVERELKSMAIVPVEPTKKMLLAGNTILPSCVNSDGVYKAMITAYEEPSDDKD